MFRRGSFAVFNFVYVHLTTLKAANRTMRLPAAVCQELIGMILLAPLLFSNVAATICSTIYATDATLEKGSIVSAQPDVEDLALYFTRAPRRGGPTWLQELSAPNLPEQWNESTAADDLLIRDMVCSTQFNLVVNYSFTHVVHVNLQETHVIKNFVQKAWQGSAVLGL